MKHFDELLIYMQDNPFDILTLNETRLDNSISDSEVKIPGSDIVRRDRNRNGGGVAMFIRSNISFTNRNNLVPELLEQICVEISKPNSKPFLVSSWYRPPDSNIEFPMRQHGVKSDYKLWLTDQIKKLCYQRDFYKKDIQHMIVPIRGIRIMLADL